MIWVTADVYGSQKELNKFLNIQPTATRIIQPTEDPFVFVKVAKVWSELQGKGTEHYFISTDGVGYTVEWATQWGLLEVGNCYKVERLYGGNLIGKVIKVSCGL